MGEHDPQEKIPEVPAGNLTASSAEMLMPMLKQLTETIQQLQATIAQLNQRLDQKDAELNELKRILFGRRSERVKSVDREIKHRRKQTTGESEESRRLARERRAQNAKARRESLPTDEQKHTEFEQELCCPHCGGTKFVELGEGEISYEDEYVPPRVVRRKHIRVKKACRCGMHIVVAKGPARVSEGVQYGPGFHAHVAVSKC